MKKIKISHIVLLLLFLMSIELRLFYSFQTPYFSSEDSFYSVRQIEHVKETGLPLIDDPLRDQSAVIMSPPLFYYIMAFFSTFAPIELIGKVIPSIFVATLVFAVYLMSKVITDDNESASLFAALVASFIPVIFRKLGVNSLTPYSLAVPMIFFMLYCFMKIRNEKYLYAYLILLVALPFVHPVSVIVIPIFIIYLFLIKMEKIRQLRAELEIIIFSSLYLVWVLFLFYKNAFLLYGPSIIWQNIPSVIVTEFFADTNILQALYNIGLLPVIFGVFVVYKSVFLEKNTKMYLLIASGMTITILLYIRLIELELGLLFLGVTLAVLLARYYQSAIEYIEKTSFSHLYIFFVTLFFAIFSITSLYPSLVHAQHAIDDTTSQDEIIALLWLDDNTPEESVILALPSEGHLVASVGKRKIIVDSQYLLIPDVNERMSDVSAMFSTQYETEALSLMTKYEIDYIYVTPNTKVRYDFLSPEYVSNEKCFELVYDKGVQIYNVKCVIEE